jgi:hypothetical protein
MREDIIELKNVLESGKSKIVKNRDLGEVFIDKGSVGKSGYGLLHIIEQRTIKDKLKDEEIVAIICLVKRAIENGKLVNEKIKIPNKYGIEKNGIIAVIKKASDRYGEKFILTGYVLNDKKEEAAEAIKTVIANYNHSTEFSDFRKQVGAVVSSLNKVSQKNIEKSSKKEEERER